jgi:hypothetical protein
MIVELKDHGLVIGSEIDGIVDDYTLTFRKVINKDEVSAWPEEAAPHLIWSNPSCSNCYHETKNVDGDYYECGNCEVIFLTELFNEDVGEWVME